MLKELSRRKIIGLLFITLMGVLLISTSIIMIYNTHKNAIVEQHKSQIITTAETASRGLETYFREKRAGMDLYFDGVMSNIDSMDFLYNQIDEIIALYYTMEKEYLYKIGFLTQIEADKLNISLPKEGQDTMFGSYEYQEDGYFVLNLYKTLYVNGEVAGYINAGIDLNKVYDEILYPIQIGKLGYCTVKDRNGIILMHGTKSQIGINSKEDRKIKHPDLDPAGVDRLVENQIRGESGSDIVLSYWWDNVEAGKVRKIIGYTPVQIVEDFWVVSVIMDYSIIEGPLHNTLSMSIVIGAVLVLFFGSLVFYITRELKNTQRMHMEWMYKAELSESAHKLKKQEEKVQQYDKLQTIGILTGTIAHEFNNLMTPIMIYCDLLNMKLGDNVEMKEDIEEITIAARRCCELSKQLLSYGRTEKEEDQLSEFDAALATRNSVKMIGKLIPSQVKLTFDISPKPIVLLGKPGIWNQILLNLCTNAYQAMKGKGGKIHISFQITEDTLAQMQVIDTGEGMDQEIMDNMYDPFFTTKAPGEGTGLGLSVVQRLVKKQGGRIQAKSTLGEGTTFIITFPVVERLQKQFKKQPIGLSDIELKKLNILIIDDKPEVIKSILKGLSITKWQLESFTNPVLAHGRLKEKPQEYDIVLTDDSMPNISGLELSAMIKRLNPSIKIIVMTGYLEKDLQEYVERRLIDTYLIKPITAKDIIDKISQLYGERRDEI